MKVKVELEIETDFYDEEAVSNKMEELITKGDIRNKSDRLFSDNSKLIKFDMYIVGEK